MERVTRADADGWYYSSQVSPYLHQNQIFFLVSDPMFLSSPSALHFSNYSFLVHHPVNWDDWHLLARAMASDFTVV
jgi:hypothetical protein